MKKLFTIVFIVALSTIMSAAVASDHRDSWSWDHNPFEDFHGTFEMISTAICLHSTSGWTAATVENDGYVGWKLTTPVGQVWAGTATARATWIFKRNGTGTLQGTNFAAIFPGADRPSYEATNPIGGTFTYEITNKGEVTVTGSTGGIAGVILNGMLSIDGNIMTLLSASQKQNFSDYGLGYVIIDNMRILIRVGH